MKHEFRKLLSDRRIPALLLAAVLVSGILFYQYTGSSFDGTSMQQIQEQYQRGIDLSEREEVLWKILSDPETQDTPDRRAAQEEYTQVTAAGKRMEQAASYEAIRTDLVSQSKVKLMLGLFGAENSFPVRSLHRGIADYEALSGVVPTVEFFGSVELLTTWHITDALGLLFALLPALFLFTFERGSGLQALTQPAKYGRFRLYAQKYGACAALSVIGALILYGVNSLIARLLFGPVSFSAPIQSVYGYAACPLEISVGEFLLILLGQKLLWILACMNVITVCAVCTGSSTLAVGLTVGGAIAGWVLGQSNLLWLHWLSPVQLAAGETLFQSALYLNFLGHPLRLLPVCITFLAILVPTGFAVGAKLYCSREISGSRGSSFSRHRLLHTNLMLHEAEKTVFLWRGLALLLVLAALQWGTSYNFSADRGIDEFYYRFYSEQLSGAPDPEKDARLAEQAARFEEIDAKLAAFAEKYGSDSEEYAAAADRASGQLRARDGFLQARDQYQMLSTGQSYLYETPYSILLGPERTRAAAVNYGKAFLTIVLLFAGFFAGEQESGMEILQTAAGKKRAILRRKLILMTGYSILIALIAFLPRILGVFHAFGGLELHAQANSTGWWADFPDGISVTGAFSLQLLKNCLVCIVAGGFVCFLSSRIGSTVLTMVTALSWLLFLFGGGSGSLTNWSHPRIIMIRL